MTSRLTFTILVALVAAVAAGAQTPPAPDLKGHVDALSDFDYPTRMNAARMVRRAEPGEAVPALTEAVRSHPDEFVRYRALVLLTSFNDRGTEPLMRAMMSDRNDRIREVVYRWYERYPDTSLTPSLLAALNTEQAEFVRPALVRALASLDADAQVQRTLLAEVGRGLDFFRSAVIEALGDHRAEYAVDALNALAVVDGPLQDDAVLALGRIGDRRALTSLSTLTNAPLTVIPALQAALCLLEDACAARLTVLSETARSRAATTEASRASVAALGAVAATGHPMATQALFDLAGDATGRLRDDVAIALAASALRGADDVLTWLQRAPEASRTSLIELLREGFESLEEDFAEEQLFAAARAAYWAAPEESVTRTVTAILIDRLEF